MCALRTNTSDEEIEGYFFYTHTEIQGGMLNRSDSFHALFNLSVLDYVEESKKRVENGAKVSSVFMYLLCQVYTEAVKSGNYSLDFI